MNIRTTLIVVVISIFAFLPGRSFPEPYIHEYSSSESWNMGIMTSFLVPIEYDNDDKYYHIILEPILDYFLTKGFHAGLVPAITLSTYGTANEFIFSLGPKARIGYSMPLYDSIYFDITPFIGYNCLSYNFTTHENRQSLDCGADLSIKIDSGSTIYNLTISQMYRMHFNDSLFSTTGNSYYFMVGMGISGYY